MAQREPADRGFRPGEGDDHHRALITRDSTAFPLHRCHRSTQARRLDRPGFAILGLSISSACYATMRLEGELGRRAAIKLADLAGGDPWCIVFPAERHQRAGAWAELLAKNLIGPLFNRAQEQGALSPLTNSQRLALGDVRVR